MLETIFTCSHLWIDVYIYVYESVVLLVMETNGVAIMKNWNKEADIWALTLICKNSAGCPQQVSIRVIWLQDALNLNFSLIEINLSLSSKETDDMLYRD